MATFLTWGLDPLYNSYRKLLVTHIHCEISVIELPAFAFTFSFLGSPISKVVVVGIVRNIIRRERRLTIIIDDGTGSIACIKYLDMMEVFPNFELTCGSLVSVHGTLMMVEASGMPYGLAMQVKKLEALHDPNEEISHWMDCMVLYNSSYSSLSSASAAASDLAPGSYPPTSMRTTCGCLSRFPVCRRVYQELGFCLCSIDLARCSFQEAIAQIKVLDALLSTNQSQSQLQLSMETLRDNTEIKDILLDCLQRDAVTISTASSRPISAAAAAAGTTAATTGGIHDIHPEQMQGLLERILDLLVFNKFISRQLSGGDESTFALNTKKR